jgi:hypothetical protein
VKVKVRVKVKMKSEGKSESEGEGGKGKKLAERRGKNQAAARPNWDLPGVDLRR